MAMVGGGIGDKGMNDKLEEATPRAAGEGMDGREGRRLLLPPTHYLGDILLSKNPYSLPP